MEKGIDAWILTIGNEITNGVITDTNRETISKELRAVGVAIKGMSSVPDDVDAIKDALELAMERARVTIVSGGLGPTEDDKTAQGAAALLGAPLELDKEQLSRIESRFQKWGRPMAPSNAKQALFPAGAAPIPNDYGTAPGFVIQRQDRIALFFPGIPREMLPMLRERGIPLILEHFKTPLQVFKNRTIHVYGLTESRLGEILADLAVDEHDYHLAFLPRFPIIRLRIDVRGDNEREVDALLAEKQEQIEARIKENIISVDGRSMEQVVLDLLEDRNMTIGLGESITGGMIGEMLTRVPGSSKTFLGSVVSYSNAMKVEALGVSEKTILSYGAVSGQCAEEMAVGARRIAKATVGLSVTGIAGPDGGSDAKPVGTFFVGLAIDENVLSRRYFLPGERAWVRKLAAMQSLDLLRRYFLGYRLHGETYQSDSSTSSRT
jgi:nicotinamide-nucleotide amidase